MRNVIADISGSGSNKCSTGENWFQQYLVDGNPKNINPPMRKESYLREQKWCHQDPPHFLSIRRSSVSKIITVETSWAPFTSRMSSDGELEETLLTFILLPFSYDGRPITWSLWEGPLSPSFWFLRNKTDLSSREGVSVLQFLWPGHLFTAHTHQTKLQ